MSDIGDQIERGSDGPEWATPRCDAVTESNIDPGAWIHDIVVLSRKLERELAEWHRIAGEQIERLTRERDVAMEAEAGALRTAVLLRAEVERENSERIKADKRYLELRAEVERLKALLLRWIAMATDGDNCDEDIVPLVRDSRAALGEE